MLRRVSSSLFSAPPRSRARLACASSSLLRSLPRLSRSLPGLRAPPRASLSSPAALSLANELRGSALPPDEEFEARAPETPAGWSVEDRQGTVGVVLSSMRDDGVQVAVRFSIESMTDPYEEMRGEEEEEEGEDEGSDVGESSVDEEGASSIATAFSVVLTKPEGSLAFDCVAEQGDVTVQAMYPVDNQLAHEYSANAEFMRGMLYQGPEIAEELSEDVQDKAAALLEESGVDESIVHFVYEYTIHKQFREFASWCTGVESFLRK